MRLHKLLIEQFSGAVSLWCTLLTSFDEFYWCWFDDLVSRQEIDGRLLQFQGDRLQNFSFDCSLLDQIDRSEHLPRGAK
ncbi:hypothetical protein MPTK1_4g16630 [Marchantia polymorpha subsp. ruderalis]|uniref:Uncharacterized protein n=2 Tax=Marchantia polymorpha TaxID=3197 RepID=A0AAF6BAK4_MARPO|nr:hypothetical protein MARPO_0054s0130 [Marchantia polymorpha]BBN09038.1 hypothetical protein Mp_4g16630 [Marchantia polymorpha subsp. ruderalis]|eukprot:PTQ38029.1 hypothetical protein MARPO_0054s0130 [Marchantia polymorpha]